MSDPEAAMIDLAGLARAGTATGPLWTHEGADLDVNLVALDSPGRIEESVNTEVDVLVVGLAGEGVIEVEGRALRLAAEWAVVIPKGARRAIRTTQGRLAYLTCHRRRAELWPSNVLRPDTDPAEAEPR